MRTNAEYKIGEVFFLKQDESTLKDGEISKVRPFIISSRYKYKDTTFIVLSPCTSSIKPDFWGNLIINILDRTGTINLGQRKKQLVMKEDKFINFKNKTFIGKIDDEDILKIWYTVEDGQTCFDQKTGQVKGHPFFKQAHLVTRLFENKFDIFDILNILNEHIV